MEKPSTPQTGCCHCGIYNVFGWLREAVILGVVRVKLCMVGQKVWNQKCVLLLVLFHLAAQQVLERRQGKGTEDRHSSIFFIFTWRFKLMSAFSLRPFPFFNISFEIGLCLDLLNGHHDASNLNFAYSYSKTNMQYLLWTASFPLTEELMLLQSSLKNIVHFRQNLVIGNSEEPFRYFSNDTLKRCSWALHWWGDIWAESLIIAWQGHLLGEERKQLHWLESWSHARGAQWQSLGFIHSSEKCLEIMTLGNKKKKKHFSCRVKVGTALLTALQPCCVVFTGYSAWYREREVKDVVDRDFIAVLMKEVHKVLWGTFFLFCSFMKVLCVLEWQGCVCVCVCIWGGPLGCVSGPGLHTYTHTQHTRTRDQRQSGSHPCLPLICVPRPACPRGAAPYHARWHHAHQRLPTTVWER